MANRSIKLKQINSGVVNVIDNYYWTVSSPKKLSRSETPRIIITEYQQTLASLRQLITYGANQAKAITKTGIDTKDPYELLYSINKSEIGNTYTLPFYSTFNDIVTNSWGENKGIFDLSTIEAGITMIGRSIFPSAGIESAKSWEGTSPTSYTFTFQLLNTIGGIDTIEKNKTLVDVIRNNNLLDKLDFMVMRPPAICQIRIPGVRGTTVGVISTLNIENIGQINYMPNYGNIPDAYQISITIQELITQSRQILADTLSDGKVFSRVENSTLGLDDITDKDDLSIIESTLGSIKE